MVYPIGVTKSPGTWNAQRNHVERILDNASYDAPHPDDSIIVAGPARKGVAVPGRNTPRTLMAIGMLQSLGIQTQVPVTPLMALGSGRSFFLRGKSQSTWNMQRVWINGRNLLRALYHNAVEVNGINADQFDDPAALENNPRSQFFVNLDSELFYIPFGLGVIMRTKSRTFVASCYLELCLVNSWGIQLAAGQGMFAEMVSGLCDRVMPFQSTDAMENIRVGRAQMDAVLGLAPTVFPVPTYNQPASFEDNGLSDGTVAETST